MNSSEIKHAQTQHAVSEFIRKRWSARAFNDTQIPQETLETLLEAASWAPSANNEQPWVYYYAFKGTEGFEKLWNCLLPGNQLWTKNASVLVLSLARKTFEANQKPNNSAKYDVGAANATLLLEATQHDIFGHIMGGFDAEKTKNMFNLDENLEPVVMMALGYLAEAETLEEPFKTRELTPRKRKSVSEISKKL